MFPIYKRENATNIEVQSKVLLNVFLGLGGVSVERVVN